MAILILVVVMVLVGLLMGAIGSLIWKEKPLGAAGDYAVAVVVAVIVGLTDWFVIPAMGFSEAMKYLGVAMEPALSALFALWIVRKVKG